ncbi:MAG TPA: hypothetical protein VIM65_12780 [Cyclobacteriaceae bacterium]
MDRDKVQNQIARLKQIEDNLRKETDKYHKDAKSFKDDKNLQEKLSLLETTFKERRRLEWSLLDKNERLNRRLQLIESAKKYSDNESNPRIQYMLGYIKLLNLLEAYEEAINGKHLKSELTFELINLKTILGRSDFVNLENIALEAIENLNKENHDLSIKELVIDIVMLYDRLVQLSSS